MRFADRRDAGRQLAELVRDLGLGAPVVLALPRGGVPVGYEVAVALEAPLDVVLVAKIGVPFQPELAMGAVGEGGVALVNHDIVRHAGVSPGELDAAIGKARSKVAAQAQRWAASRSAVVVERHDAVLVDDGLATGASMRAAVEVVRARGAGSVVVAVPVGPPDTVGELAGLADRVVAVATPSHFSAVGLAYADFTQTTDADVERFLVAAASL
jgi:putative phosphoribosyl transferase